MNTINERIRYIRKQYDLTQLEFGKRIGVKANTVTGYEKGTRNPTDVVIRAICREFDINEIWLRTGSDEMYVNEIDEKRFYRNIGKLQWADDETIIRWVNAIAETNPDTLKEIEQFFIKILNVSNDVDSDSSTSNSNSNSTLLAAHDDALASGTAAEQEEELAKLREDAKNLMKDE